MTGTILPSAKRTPLSWEDLNKLTMPKQPRASITVIIVEDDRIQRKRLKELLTTRHPGVEVLGEAEDVPSAVELIRQHRPDLLFLDIGLRDDLDGFAVLEEFGPAAPHVIITTADKQHALKAWNFSVIHFLLKPLAAVDLDEAVAKVEAKMEQGEAPTELVVPKVGGFDLVSRDEILYCKGAGSQTYLYMTGGERSKPKLVSRSIGDLEKDLKTRFIRVHKTHLVNRMHIKSFESGNVILKNGTKISVARDRIEEVKKVLRGDSRIVP